MVAKLVMDPEFRVRTIERKSVGVPALNKRKQSSQVNVVQQGFASYSDDRNAFNAVYA